MKLGDNMNYYIKAVYRKSIFENDKGFLIGICKIKETNCEELEIYVGKTITFTGTFASLNLDDEYILYGEPVFHPKYGFQYQVSSYERIKPSDRDGIVSFLCSDLFHGIGEKMANNIVDVLGDGALDQIIADPSCLNLVSKLSYKKAKNIYDTLVKYEESHTTIVYLTELGFSTNDALSIYNKYKSETVSVIENNIYKLIDDVLNIGFKKVDNVALKQGINITDSERIKACIMYIIENNCYTKGDTYIEKEDIIKGVISYIKSEVDETLFDTYLDALRFDNKIILKDNHYYLKNLYDDEVYVAKRFNDLLTLGSITLKKFDKYIKEEERNQEITYSEMQKSAIKNALENNITVITGGPGTGKTTLIKAIVNIYMSINKIKLNDVTTSIALLSPTGRASKRMSEATLIPAMTIHRFLKWNKENNEFGINMWNKSEVSLAIIDEASMVDIELLTNLLKGLKKNTKIILVGDANQLASVGPGQILRDIIDSDIIPTIKLDILYRQDNNSYIAELAQEIQNNNLSDNFLETRDDYTFVRCRKEIIPQAIEELAKKLVSKDYSYREVQFMAPMYAGINGIDNLNRILQDIWNPKDEFKNEINLGDITFRENDKVLELVNVPDENIYNGDIGVIERIVKDNVSKSKKTEIYVNFDGNIVKFEPKDFGKLKLGYIISIHKSQGSEFDIVVLPICSSYYRMLYRKLIYTGITRAKRKLILVGEADSFVYSVNNNEEYKRKTTLKENIEYLCINN